MAISIGTLSYAAAAAAFLFLFLLLVTSWRGRLQGMLLATASLCNAIWAGQRRIWRRDRILPCCHLMSLEVVRSAVWFAFLMVLLGYSRQKVEPLRRAAAGLAAFCGVVLVVTLYSGAISGTRLDMFEMLSRLVLAVIGMVLVEQLYRNVRPQQRWGIKFLCLGARRDVRLRFLSVLRIAVVSACQRRHLGRAGRGQCHHRAAARRGNSA
jgi:hypothetical protein